MGFYVKELRCVISLITNEHVHGHQVSAHSLSLVAILLQLGQLDILSIRRTPRLAHNHNHNRVNVKMSWGFLRYF